MAVAAGRSSNALGIIYALGGTAAFTVNDVAVKFLSDGYALHQLVLMRTLIAMTFLLAVMVPMAGGLAVLRTRRPFAHMLRGLCVVVANMFFFLALATMPLADATAIFFVSPLMITVLSVVFLGEKVGPRRWMAVFLGLVGAVVMMRPGTDAFQVAALLPVIAAAGYAVLNILARVIGGTERAVTMAFYIQLTFLFVSLLMGLAVGDGRFEQPEDATLAFLLREWVWPAVPDLPVLFVLGIASALGGFMISQAYRLAEPAVAAPFEYTSMPMAIFFGVLIFAEWPDLVAWAGICLIVGSGLYLFWREAEQERQLATKRPQNMR